MNRHRLAPFGKLHFHIEHTFPPAPKLYQPYSRSPNARPPRTEDFERLKTNLLFFLSFSAAFSRNEKTGEEKVTQ